MNIFDEIVCLIQVACKTKVNQNRTTIKLILDYHWESKHLYFPAIVVFCKFQRDAFIRLQILVTIPLFPLNTHPGTLKKHSFL